MASRLSARAAAIALCAAVALAATAWPAAAHTTDSFDLSPDQAVAGTSVVATAVWTAESTDVLSAVITLPAPLQASVVWDSATGTASGGATVVCVIDTPTYEAACLLPSPTIGETLTVTATFTLPADTPTGTYPLTAEAEAFQTELYADLTVLSAATPTIAVTPPAIQPGGTATATATFTAETTGDIHVGVYLFGTNGNGTFAPGAIAPGLTGCALDGVQRAYTCTWAGASIGDTRTIQIPVVAGTGTPSGSTFTVEAATNSGTPAARVASTSLAIQGASPTPSPTTPPSSTATPTTSAAVAGSDPSTAQLAATGPTSHTLTLAAIILLLTGLAATIGANHFRRTRS